jgi:protein-S-isoprenylcysteine O-methyltransferase Ste14
VTATTGTAPLRAGAGEHLLGRALPGATFAVLLYIEVVRFASHVRSHAAIVDLAGQVLYLVFIGMFIVLTVVRPPARAMDRRVLPWVATCVGAFGLVVSPILFASGPRVFNLGELGSGLQAGLVLASILGSLVSLSLLGTAFSLTPQARHLVVRGPYRMVRHPLYLFEGLAMVGGLLASGSLTAVLATSLVLGAQLVRIRYEEILLTTVFPDYQERFAGVAHLIPGIY